MHYPYIDLKKDWGVGVDIEGATVWLWLPLLWGCPKNTVKSYGCKELSLNCGCYSFMDSRLGFGGFGYGFESTSRKLQVNIFIFC